MEVNQIINQSLNSIEDFNDYELINEMSLVKGNELIEQAVGNYTAIVKHEIEAKNIRLNESTYDTLHIVLDTMTKFNQLITIINYTNLTLDHINGKNLKILLLNEQTKIHKIKDKEGNEINAEDIDTKELIDELSVGQLVRHDLVSNCRPKPNQKISKSQIDRGKLVKSIKDVSSPLVGASKEDKLGVQNQFKHDVINAINKHADHHNIEFDKIGIARGSSHIIISGLTINKVKKFGNIIILIDKKHFSLQDGRIEDSQIIKNFINNLIQVYVYQFMRSSEAQKMIGESIESIFEKLEDYVKQDSPSIQLKDFDAESQPEIADEHSTITDIKMVVLQRFNNSELFTWFGRMPANLKIESSFIKGQVKNSILNVSMDDVELSDEETTRSINHSITEEDFENRPLDPTDEMIKEEEGLRINAKNQTSQDTDQLKSSLLSIKQA